MIYLYGKLRKVFGDSIDCEVHSIQELVKAAEANRPGFRDHIQRDRKYLIRRGDEFRKGKDVGEDEVEMRFAATTWHVLPMPEGYGGAVKLVLGAVMVVIGVYTPFKFMIPLGLSLMLSGGAELLFKNTPPTADNERDASDERPSYLFNGPTNRVAAGGAVPLVYGFYVFVGSQLVSGGIKVKEATFVQTPAFADAVQSMFSDAFDYSSNPPEGIVPFSAWWEDQHGGEEGN